MCVWMHNYCTGEGENDVETGKPHQRDSEATPPTGQDLGHSQDQEHIETNIVLVAGEVTFGKLMWKPSLQRIIIRVA